jgi:hypothetical protein
LKGQIKLSRLSWDASPRNYERETTVGEYPANRVQLGNPAGRSNLGFRLVRTTERNAAILIPYWSPVLLMLSATLAGFIRPSKQYSIFTLLLATMMVAMMLGGIMVAVR